MLKIWLTALLLTLCQQALFSQNSINQNSQINFFKLGLDLMDRGNYGAARTYFEKYINSGSAEVNIKTEAQYYVAFCALNLYNKDSERLMNDFIDNNPDHPKAIQGYFEMGSFYYGDKNYKKAIHFFEKTDFNQLTSQQQIEAHFKTGYSYFANKKFEQALVHFNILKRQNIHYSPASNYYAGYTEYQLGQFDNALVDLKRAERAESYTSIVPSMIASVYYKQERYDELITYSENSLEKLDQIANLKELYLLLADAYFFNRNYTKAKEYFDEFISINKAKSNHDVLYRIAYTQYVTGDNQSAIDNFKQIAVDKSQLGSLSSYFLGLLYLKEGNLPFAATALDKARHISTNEQVKEEALYQFSKVNLELNRSAIAIESMQAFSKQYSQSGHLTEINDLLSQAFLTTNNYDLAISHIESIPQKSRILREAYQKATFHKGVELFNRKKFRDAIKMFEKSLENPFDQEIILQAIYWIGETYSIGKRYEQALDYYLRVINSTADYDNIKNSALYGLGYCYYNTKQYPKALLRFRQFIANANKEKPRYYDAVTRLADCYYVTKSYNEALRFYQESLAAKPYRAYGYLQIGIVKAILSQDKEATANFDIVIKNYNKSPYYDDAMFEKAQLAFEKGNYKAGSDGFKELINQQPNSKYIPYALQNKAIANFNLNNYNIVIEDYTTFLDKFATHKEANNVLLGLQEVLTLQNRSAEFDQFLDKYKQRNPDQEGLELVEFEAAKNLYFNQNYEEAINRFIIYIENYPEALNTTEAKYYIGESFYRLNQDGEAMDYYDQVLQEPEFSFYPRVIQRIADIQFKQGNYENAVIFYNRLLEEAINARQQNNGWTGLMQSFYYMAEYDSVDYFARQILDQGNVAIDAQNKSLLFFGKSAYARGDFDSALDLFLETLNSAKDEHGAEAQFLLAEILYQQNKYTESNEALYELHHTFSGFQVWYDRSFLQIADNFIGLEETFQAKQTLNSLIENSSLSFIVEQARQKLKSIEDTEASEIENGDQPEADTVNQNNDNGN